MTDASPKAAPAAAPALPTEKDLRGTAAALRSLADEYAGKARQYRAAAGSMEQAAEALAGGVTTRRRK